MLLKLLFLPFLFLSLWNSAHADEYELVILNADEETVQEAESRPGLREQAKKGLKVSTYSNPQTFTPSVDEVEAILYELQIDTSKMDQLDRDMFVMALRLWSADRIVKKFKGKVSEQDIRKAWKIMRE